MLNDTRVSDAGIYRCMVNNPPEITDPGIGELVLSVLGKLLRVEQLAEALTHYDHLPKQELVIHLSFFFSVILTMIFVVFQTKSAKTAVDLFVKQIPRSQTG